jgi:predicted dehydrogenase
MGTRLSRRDFIRRSTGATLAAQSVLWRPTSLVAASPRGVPPSDTIHFGIIGVGMQGSGLLDTAIKLPGVKCVAACDLYDGRLELAKEIVEEPIITTRHYRELLENKNIDCIVAAVPDHWHKQIVVETLNAGKGIYCEKPMTHRVEEGFEIIEAAERTRRIVQIGSQRRSSLGFSKAKELYEQGAIGEVSLVEAVLGRNDPCGAWQYQVPPDLTPQALDWETWLGTAPKRPFDPIRWARWRCYQDYGEGLPGDLFVHSLTGIHYVMGVDAPPKRALSSGGLFRWKDGRDVPDVLTTLYEYPKFRATVQMTLNSDLPEVTRFMGTRGMIEVDGDGDGSVRVYPQDGMDHQPCTPGWPKKLRTEYAERWHQEHDLKAGTAKAQEAARYYPPPDYDSDRDHLWNFFQSIRTGQPSVEDAHFGNNTAIGCHMANYSYFEKAIATWDGEARKIKS